MSFFEPPPPRPKPEPREPKPRPEWLGPPENVLPGVVPLTLMLARTDAVAVAVTDLEAFPAGLAFVLNGFWRSPDPRRVHRYDTLTPSPGPTGELDDVFLRVGVELADGAKATNLAPWPPPDTVPTGPHLMPGGGGWGDMHFDHGFWLWPLPPPGPLAFVCEWPAEGIPLTRAEVDAGVVRAAAKRAELLWDGPTFSPLGGGGHGYAVAEAVEARE